MQSPQHPDHYPTQATTPTQTTIRCQTVVVLHTWLILRYHPLLLLVVGVVVLRMSLNIPLLMHNILLLHMMDHQTHVYHQIPVYVQYNEQQQQTNPCRQQQGWVGPLQGEQGYHHLHLDKHLYHH